MRTANKVFMLILIAALAAGCGLLPAPSGVPVAAAQTGPTATPPEAVMVEAPPGSTPTPTPFQPIPPTAAFFPTDTPLPTATPLPPIPTVRPPRQSGGGGVLRQPPNQINILLLGSDARPRSGRYFRTDSIILATLNNDLGTVNLTSFPRDLWVSIPGNGENRINTAFEFGGFDLLAKTFENNFGVRPDHYVLIDFSSFKQIIDSLGGLDVDVGTTVSDWRSGYYVTIKAGVVHMDADTALWYARTRKTSNDFARGKRQQEVLKALAEKMFSINAIKRVPEFYAIYKDNFVTDLGFGDIIRLLPLAAKISDSSHIHHYFVSPKEVAGWVTPGGAMVLLPQYDRIRSVLRKALNID